MQSKHYIHRIHSIDMQTKQNLIGNQVTYFIGKNLMSGRITQMKNFNGKTLVTVEDESGPMKLRSSSGYLEDGWLQQL